MLFPLMVWPGSFQATYLKQSKHRGFLEYTFAGPIRTAQEVYKLDTTIINYKCTVVIYWIRLYVYIYIVIYCIIL